VVDIATSVGLPVAATEALLRDMERRGLVARAEIGLPPVLHWGPA
jgi:hypothetical protein